MLSSPSPRHFSLTAGAQGAYSELMATGRSSPSVCILTLSCLCHQTLYWHLFLISSHDQDGGGTEVAWNKLNCICLNRLTMVLKGGESINAVNFLFNPNILVGKTIITCLAYVKLQSIFMRPLLKNYKLCKYINKFCVSFNTSCNLAAPGLCPPGVQPARGRLSPSTCATARRALHLPSLEIFLPSHRSHPSTPSPNPTWDSEYRHVPL